MKVDSINIIKQTVKSKQDQSTLISATMCLIELIKIRLEMLLKDTILIPI